MSNLESISMSNEYAPICGITKEELFTALANEIRDMAQPLNVPEPTVLKNFKKKYDGYHFSKNPQIYIIAQSAADEIMYYVVAFCGKHCMVRKV
ncbi:MAG: AAA family ATPase [Proteobacteria bacterium]|nr:AAA family ATPase [Pseudomonadota bacterium]